MNKIYRRYQLEVFWEIFLVDLMEFSFREFDLIMGVDWLVEHQVNLNCASKKVILKTSVGM